MQNITVNEDRVLVRGLGWYYGWTTPKQTFSLTFHMKEVAVTVM